MISTSGRPAQHRYRLRTEVLILRWPLEEGRRQEALDRGAACLWLLGVGELVPQLGPDEDWVRLPVDERDLHVRVARLAERSHRTGDLVPREAAVDGDGLLWFRGARVVVPAVEAAILDRLGLTPGRVVPRRDLAEAAWPGEVKDSRALDGRVRTLRLRIAPAGLAIHTVHNRGLVLTATTNHQQTPATQAPSRRSPWSSS